MKTIGVNAVFLREEVRQATETLNIFIATLHFCTWLTTSQYKQTTVGSKNFLLM